MLTLLNQRLLTNDMLIKGIIDSVVTVNQFYAMLPFKGIQGNALAYNREIASLDQQSLVNTLSTANTAAPVDGTAFTGINKVAQTFSRHSTELTTIIGDAQVNGLIQAVGSDYNDATAVQVAAKAKGLGRTYMNTLVNGQLSTGTQILTGSTVVGATFATKISNAASNGTFTAAQLATNVRVIIEGIAFDNALLATSTTVSASGAAANNLVERNGALTDTTDRKTSENGPSDFDGLEAFVLGSKNFVAPSAVASTTAGFAARLDYLDQIIDRVHDKDGMVDYLMMNSAGVRKITQAFRAAGTGFDMMDVKNSSGSVMSIQSYRGVPIFRNDFIGTGVQTGFAGGDNNDSSVVYAGTLDDGSFSHGICGLTALKSAGMQVQKLGAREEADATITRVKWYCGLAHFSELGLVRGHMG